MTQIHKKMAIEALRSMPTWKAKLWYIWASKTSECPKCEQPPFVACINLNDKRAGRRVIRHVAWPHDSRIDWDLLVDGLQQRGYIHD